VVEKVQEKPQEEAEAKPNRSRPAYRVVAADLVESVPDNGGLAHWVLASPALIFLAWLWVDLFAHFSPIASYWTDAVIGLVIYLFVVVLPFGLGAFYLVTTFPRLFSHAGWDVQPLETVSEAEMYLVRYRFQNCRRAPNHWQQLWPRAAKGWVYLEVAAILIGGVAMIPLFLSVSEFGFGQP
jgi:hypothetical protein